MTGDVLAGLRNQTAWWLANAALRIATPWYRNMIAGSIRYGLTAAQRDEAASRREEPQ